MVRVELGTTQCQKNYSMFFNELLNVFYHYLNYSKTTQKLLRAKNYSTTNQKLLRVERTNYSKTTPKLLQLIPQFR